MSKAKALPDDASVSAPQEALHAAPLPHDAEVKGARDADMSPADGEDTQTEDVPLPTPPATQSVNMDALRVKIDFRVGQITLPVNALHTLAPGFTLQDMPGVIFPRVEAVVNDTVFAEGELIDIDGKIGFRILRITG